MTCREFLRLLDEDGPVDAAPASDHVATCASCRRARERWRVTKSDLAAMNADPLPPFLHARIMAHIKAEREKRPRPSWKWLPVARWVAPLAVFGLVVVIVGHGLWRAPKPLDRDQALEPSPLREPMQAHQKADLAKARTSADKARVDIAGSDAVTTKEPARMPAQFSVNGRRPTPHGGVEGFSFAPDVSIDRVVKSKEMGLQEEAREEPRRRVDEAALPEESETSVAPRDIESKRRTSGHVGALGEDAVPMAPQAAAAPMLARHGKGETRTRRIACLLTPMEDSAPPRSLELPSDDAPPAGVVWLITVLADGRVSIADVKKTESLKLRSRVSLEDDALTTEKEAAAIQEPSLNDQYLDSESLKRSESFRDIPPGRYLLRRSPTKR